MTKTNPAEFELFVKCLLAEAPAGFVPYLIPIQAKNKLPDFQAIANRAPVQSHCCGANWMEIFEDGKPSIVCEKCKAKKSSWQNPYARLTIPEATRRLERGLNVGIAACADDPLILLDFDSALDTTVGTLTVRSRKRIGGHKTFFTSDPQCKRTVKISEFGELRGSEAYVLVAGSFVNCATDELKAMPENQRELAGQYTVEVARVPAWIAYEQLPKEFQTKTTKTGEPAAATELTLRQLLELPNADSSQRCSAVMRYVNARWKPSEVQQKKAAIVAQTCDAISVLNRWTDYDPEKTRKHVQEVVQKYGTKPNPLEIARQLKLVQGVRR